MIHWHPSASAQYMKSGGATVPARLRSRAGFPLGNRDALGNVRLVARYRRNACSATFRNVSERGSGQQFAVNLGPLRVVAQGTDSWHCSPLGSVHFAEYPLAPGNQPRMGRAGRSRPAPLSLFFAGPNRCP